MNFKMEVLELIKINIQITIIQLYLIQDYKFLNIKKIMKSIQREENNIQKSNKS